MTLFIINDNNHLLDEAMSNIIHLLGDLIADITFIQARQEISDEAVRPS
jgi:hypothetical protein